MNVELARTFLEVVNCGSLARAAEKLHVTHSTVTMRLKVLEDLLRTRLLIRNRSGANMTAAGRRFYPLAESLCRVWELTRREMSLASGFDGLLSVGAPAILWDDLMFEWAKKSRIERPEIAIRCEVGQSEQLMDRLFEGWLDICLVFEPRARSGFTVDRLFEDPLITVCTVERNALERWDPDYIQIEWEDGIRRQEQSFYPDLIETPHLSAQTPELAIRFLMEFGGSALVPERILRTRQFSRPLYRVPDLPTFEQTVYLVYSQNALDERFPNMTINQLRKSLINQLNGQTQIWELGEMRRRRKAAGYAMSQKA
ncbi:MAG: LysR family transcriptional regulator [Mesorhizobium sp.]|nr:MAG: LysR family transcriptional regulator [Mesorhizobium sp.]